jgi:hypothetical protein
MRAVNFHAPWVSITRVTPADSAPLKNVKRNSADARTPPVSRDTGKRNPVAGSVFVPNSSTAWRAAELEMSVHPA